MTPAEQLAEARRLESQALQHESFALGYADRAAFHDVRAREKRATAAALRQQARHQLATGGAR